MKRQPEHFSIALSSPLLNKQLSHVVIQTGQGFKTSGRTIDALQQLLFDVYQYTYIRIFVYICFFDLDHLPVSSSKFGKFAMMRGAESTDGCNTLETA